MSTPMPPNASDASPLSEADFLHREAQLARAAMEQSAQALKQSLRTATDLKLWAEHHPWLTVGAAAAGGFATGSAIGSALSGTPPTAANGQPPPGVYYGPYAPPKQPSTAWSSMMGPLFDLAKVAIQSTIASAMGGAMQAQAQEQANHEQEPQERTDEALAASTGLP
jgi:hypothetical protein